MSSPTVLSIGTFDGVHIGHQSLIRRARTIAAKHPGARVVALVFKPNPLEVLRPQAAPPRLSMFEQRKAWILQAGADEVVRLEPTPQFLAESAEIFVSECVAKYRPIAFVEGDDFHFGKNRAGNNQLLADMGKTLGFTVEVVPTVDVALSDHQIVSARSTVVRWLLSGGRVRDAAIVLGRPYELIGTVVPGDRRGRTIGFPTANLDTPTMIPADGVYAAHADLPDGRTLPAAVSIGTKPTFGPNARAVEAFLIQPSSPCHGMLPLGATARADVQGLTARADPKAGHPVARWSPIDGLPEYGWTLRLRMAAWVREQVRFHSLDALLDQMDRDCRRCEEIIRSGSIPAIPSDIRTVTTTTRPSEEALA